VSRIYRPAVILDLPSLPITAIVPPRMYYRVRLVEYYVKDRRLIVNCAATKVNVATPMVVGMLIVPAAMIVICAATTKVIVATTILLIGIIIVSAAKKNAIVNFAPTENNVATLFWLGIGIISVPAAKIRFKMRVP